MSQVGKPSWAGSAFHLTQSEWDTYPTVYSQVEVLAPCPGRGGMRGLSPNHRDISCPLAGRSARLLDYPIYHRCRRARPPVALALLS